MLFTEIHMLILKFTRKDKLIRKAKNSLKKRLWIWWKIILVAKGLLWRWLNSQVSWRYDREIIWIGLIKSRRGHGGSPRDKKQERYSVHQRQLCRPSAATCQGMQAASRSSEQWPMAHSQQGNGVLTLTTSRHWILPHLVSLEEELELQIRMQASWCLNFSLVRIREANPATLGLDSWPTGLWVDQSMLSEATKCVEMCYAAIENHYCTCLRRCERTGTPRRCRRERRKHSHLGKEFGSVFQSWAFSYQKIANLCLVFTQEK